MKNILFSTAFIFTLITNCFAQSTIELTVKNVKENNGNIMIALCNNPNSFPDTTYKEVKTKSNSKDVVVVFENIPNGEYAIAIYQDEDDNGKLTKGMFGPKEPYAFSNNATGTFGPPEFDNAKFEVTNKDILISIDMNK